MSLKTWKEMYYPTDAMEATGSELEAIRNCIVKWEGLRPAALIAHKVDLGEIKGSPCLVELDSEPLEITWKTCALCRRHPQNCNGCTLAKAARRHGMENCFEVGDGEQEQSPYDEFAMDENPEPMISLLKEAEAICHKS
jgi:hypothetical protein